MTMQTAWLWKPLGYNDSVTTGGPVALLGSSKWATMTRQAKTGSRWKGRLQFEATEGGRTRGLGTRKTCIGNALLASLSCRPECAWTTTAPPRWPRHQRAPGHPRTSDLVLLALSSSSCVHRCYISDTEHPTAAMVQRQRSKEKCGMKIAFKNQWE